MKIAGILLLVVVVLLASPIVLNSAFGIDVEPVMKYYDLTTKFFIWEHLFIGFCGALYMIFKPEKSPQG